MARVRLLGRPRVEGQQPRGRKAWALLARVALTERPLSRRELAAELFADADDPLGALRWALGELRRVLDVGAGLGGDPVRLRRDAMWLDVWALEDGTLPAGEL